MYKQYKNVLLSIFCILCFLGLNQVARAEKIKSLQEIATERVLECMPIEKNEKGTYDFADEEWKNLEKDNFIWKILARQVINSKKWTILNENINFKKFVLSCCLVTQYLSVKKDSSLSDEEKLCMLKQSADIGNEDGIYLLLESYLQNKHGLNTELTKDRGNCLNLISYYAAGGSESAIYFLLKIYKEGELGLKKYKKRVQRRGLFLVQKFAKKGSAEAIRALLNAYLEGEFGLDRSSAIVQKKGLRLAEQYAIQGNQWGISYLLLAYWYGRWGLMKDDPNVQKRGLELAYEYHNKGSEVATQYLLNAYCSGGFGIDITDPAVQKEGKELIQKILKAKDFSFIGYLH